MNIEEKPALVYLKQFPIETKIRNKKLSVIKGNLFDDASDTIIIPSYGKEKAEGELYNLFVNNRSLHYPFTERKIIENKLIGWIGVSSLDEEKKHSFVIHPMEEEGEKIGFTKLKELVSLTFSALTAFIYEGNQVTSIAMPVLYRKGIEEKEYMTFIQYFIYEAADFLRKHEETKEIKIYVWKENDVQLWNQVLEKAMTTSASQIEIRQGITEIKGDIVTLLQSSILKESIPFYIQNIFFKELQIPYPNMKEVTLASGKLTDWLCLKIFSLPGIPAEWKHLDSWKKLFQLKKSRLVAEWVVNYMISIKSFERYQQNHRASAKSIYLFFLELFQMINFGKNLLVRSGESF